MHFAHPNSPSWPCLRAFTLSPCLSCVLIPMSSVLWLGSLGARQTLWGLTFHSAFCREAIGLVCEAVPGAKGAVRRRKVRPVWEAAWGVCMAGLGTGPRTRSQPSCQCCADQPRALISQLRLGPGPVVRTRCPSLLWKQWDVPCPPAAGLSGLGSPFFTLPFAPSPAAAP